MSENWNGAAKMPYTKSTLDKMNTSKVITNSKHTKRKQESSVKRKSEKENSQEKRYTIEAYKQKKMWEKRLNENYFKLFRRTRSMSISRKERFRSSNTEQQGRRWSCEHTHRVTNSSWKIKRWLFLWKSKTIRKDNTQTRQPSFK